MSTTARRNVAKLLTGCMLVSALSSVGTLPAQAAGLEGNRNMVTHVSGDTTKYYYNDLVEKGYDLAVKFYDVLEEMNANGDFLDGVIQYDMGSIVSSGELKQWVEYGDLTIPKAFGAARDSFLLDHPELFYIDIYKIMLSAGRTGGTYKGYIDSGRDDTIYRDGAFKTEEEVEAAIQKYEAAVKRVADAARTAAEVDGAYNILYKDDCILAMAANDQLASVKYDFDSYFAHTEAEDGEEVVEDMLSHTAYGALVRNKAVCSGFSAAYKAVMDELGVPCVIVSGYSRGRDANGNYTDGDIGHAWNYVQLETKARDAVLKDDGSVDTQADEVAYEWFAFDPTWNSVAADKARYSVMDKATEGREHYTIPAISSSGYEMNYPQISSLSYAKAIGADANGEDTTDEKFAYRRETKPSGSSLQVLEYVSYDGMNATQLTEETGMRIATRYYYAKQDGSKEWSQWQDLANFVALDEIGFGIFDDGNETIAFVANNMITTQFAVVDGITPDVDMPDWKIFGGWYSDSDAVQAAAVFMSKEYQNPVYGTYTASPYLRHEETTPNYKEDIYISDKMADEDNPSMMADKHAIHIKLVYDEPLHVLDETKPIVVNFTEGHGNIHQYAGFVPFEDGELVHLTKGKSGLYDTLEFRFKPSLMYEHNRAGYTFSFENVGSAKIVDRAVIDKDPETGMVTGQHFVQTTSDKAPNSAYYVFTRYYICCPMVFGDGRLWIGCCAQPTLVDNSDLSTGGFTDSAGNSTFSEQAKSQMMLVVSDVATKQENAIKDEITKSDLTSVNGEDILSCKTYDIKLQVCGRYAKISDGSYVKIALGFPDGYGPEDTGTVFKLFHRKHIQGDEYIIEEVPCVMTPFGIVATVESFSPYMIAAIDPNAVSVEAKTVYATINGKGGKLSLEDGKVRSFEPGDVYDYTVMPDEGYQLFSVTLNGEDVTDKVVDGKLAISYEDLPEQGNEVEIKFLADGAVQRVQENTIVEPVKTIANADGSTSTFGGPIQLPEAQSHINIAPNTVEMKVGDEPITLTATVEPTTDKAITWTSSNEAVVKVEETTGLTNKIAAVAEGTATVTAKIGDVSATCEVSVSKKPSTNPGGNSGSSSSGSSSGSSGSSTSNKPHTCIDKKNNGKCDVCGKAMPVIVDQSCDGKDKCPTAKYKDVTTAWYHEAVDFAVTNKVMIGQSDDIWGIGKTITRAETAQIMYNLLADKAAAPAVATFGDVNTDDWFFTAVEWANANGLMVGVGADKFEPTRPVTRQEFAAVLYRLKANDMSDKELRAFQKECEAVSLEQFADAQVIDSWAVNGIKMCVDNDIINGNQAKQLLPKNGTSREEAAQMLMGYLEVK